MNKTIKLKSYVGINIEGVAGEAVKPGALVELQSDGTYDNQDTAAAAAAKLFALEDELQGNAITDAYALNDPMQIFAPVSGEEVLALMTGTPAIGTLLEAAGDGTLRAVTTGVAIAQVIGASQTDSNSDVRYPVRIL